MLTPFYKPFFCFSILIILSLSGIYAQAPWTRVTPTPIEKDINDIARIPGTERLIAVADGSTIMTSDDAGETWDISLHPANLQNDYRINDIYFIDNQTGFIGGGGNSILKTTDGGESWSLKFMSGTLYSGHVTSEINFMNDTTGFAIGGFGEILKTTDGGDTWFQADTFQWANRFHRVSPNTAYITNHIPGVWMKTTDGGETWVTENNPFGNPGEYITDMKFLNESAAIAALYTEYEGTCKLYKTTNAGETWTEVYTTSWDLTVNKFDFFDELNGIALCWSLQYHSSILITNDGGNTWIESEDPIGWQNMNVTRYYDQNIILAAGSNGFLYKSTDAGMTWSELSERELGGEIFNVQFVNENIGFLSCNSIGGGGISTDLYKTIDGGITWNNFDNQTYPSAFNFLSDSLGFVVGDAAEVYKYVHGDWLVLETGFSFVPVEVMFLDEMNGAIAGEGGVIKTADGGLTWSDITPLPNPGIEYNNIVLTTPDHVYVTSWDNVYRSFDGGWSWQSTSLSEFNQINDLFMLNEDRAFIVAGSDILISLDGTVTWSPGEINTNGYFYAEAIYFPNSTTGYAVGSGEYDNIVKTTDGGITWNSLTPISSTPLSCVYFSDENNGLVFGDLGLVMKTETGGVVSAGNIPIAEENISFFVNPNPFSRELSIGFNRKPVFPVDMTISDITGKTISDYVIKDSSEAMISTDRLKSGVYILSIVYQDGSIETRKVIKL